MSQIAAPDATPDWASTPDDLACPLCSYNLRGLTEPRCPECGFTFRWADLLDAKRDRHPWLFEHGRGHSVRSFFATYARSCVPRRFWRQVTPANPVNVNRLFAYWLVAGLSLIAMAFASVPVTFVVQARPNLTARAAYATTNSPPNTANGPYYYTLTPAEVDAQFPALLSTAFARQAWGGVNLHPDRSLALVALVPLSWPWLSQAALMIFQSSMRRAKVNPAHVLRVTIYCCDFSLLLMTTVVAALAARECEPIATMLSTEARMTPLDLLTRPLVAAIIACALIATYRLTIAYGRYLRFDRPFLTVLASQVIAVLVAIGVIILLGR